MKSGKVNDMILNRSVIKNIKYRSKYGIVRPKVGNDAYVTQDGIVNASANAGLIFDEKLLKFDCKRALLNACSNVYAEGGIPEYVTVNIFIPEKRLENELKELTRYIADLCKSYELDIAGGNTEVTRSVNTYIINFAVTGRLYFDNHISYKEYIKSDMDIVMTGYCATSGSIGLAYEKYDELTTRFQKSYIQNALDMEDYMDTSTACKIALENGVRLMHDMSRGGIYLALFELAKKINRGVCVDMDKINFKQVTIEICEYLEINPYKLMSNGSMLMVCEDGKALVKALENKEIKASVIGNITDSNDKVLMKNEDKHFIEPPRRDEVYILLNNR